MEWSVPQILGILVALVVVLMLGKWAYNKYQGESTPTVVITQKGQPATVAAPPPAAVDNSWLGKLEGELGGVFGDMKRGGGMIMAKEHDLMQRSSSASAPLRESMVASISDAQYGLGGGTDLDEGVANASLVRAPPGHHVVPSSQNFVRLE